MTGHCFAPGCSSGYSSTQKKNKAAGKRNPSMFLAPKDTELLEKWRRLIPRKDKTFGPKDHLCELHFHEDCIDKNYVHKMPDGTVCVIEKGKIVLRKGSIPSIFPNTPKYFSKVALKRKQPVTRVPIPPKQRKVDLISDEAEVVPDSVDIYEDLYFNLVCQLTDIQKPNSWWKLASTEQYIICSKWDASFKNVQNVFLCQDMSVKIFLGNKEIYLTNMVVKDVATLSSLLLRVDKLLICQAAKTGEPVCNGFIQVNSPQQKASNWCAECSILRKENVIRKKENLWATKNLKIAQQVKCVQKKNIRLQKKEEENSLAVISTTTDDAERQVDEFNLSNNIQLVKLPNQWWTIHSFPNYVACARWNDTFLLDRRVIIKNDNSIKVSLYDIDLQTKEKVSCIQDVSFLLQKIDDNTPCSKATNKFSFSLNLHDLNEDVL